MLKSTTAAVLMSLTLTTIAAASPPPPPDANGVTQTPPPAEIMPPIGAAPASPALRLDDVTFTDSSIVRGMAAPGIDSVEFLGPGRRMSGDHVWGDVRTLRDTTPR